MLMLVMAHLDGFSRLSDRSKRHSIPCSAHPDGCTGFGIVYSRPERRTQPCGRIPSLRRSEPFHRGRTTVPLAELPSRKKRTGQKGRKQENECFLHAANYQRLIFSDSKLFLLAFPRKAPKESVKA